MTLREFFAILRQRWMTVAASALVVLAATAAVTLSMQPTYTASARVYFAAESPVDPETGARGATYVLTQSDLDTYIEVLSSPTVVTAIREEVGTDAGFGVSGTASSSTSILEITATSTDPEVAARVANVAGAELAAVAPQFSALLLIAGQEVTSTFISEADVPTTPTSPDVMRNLTLGLLAGLAAGIGLAFVRHALDTRVRGEQDIEAVSDRPVLAALPFDRHAAERPLVVESEPFSPHSEEFRRLRANLAFADVTTRSHSVVVTSAIPGEGKTTTAANLAIAMADSGLRVLLVDADLRNPSVARTMGLDGSTGLTTLLVGRAQLREAAQPWKDTSLWVLPAGEVPPNPSELLGSAAMKQLFDDLASRFDFVILDSPPIVPVIDAVLLDSLAGGTLVVVSVDKIRKRFLAQALKSLHTAGAHVTGFALNMVPVTSSGPYYGYGYGYHHDAASPSAPKRRRDVARSGRGSSRNATAGSSRAVETSSRSGGS